MSTRHTLLATRHASAALLVALIATALACVGGPSIDPEPDIPEHVEYDTVRIDYGEDDQLETTTDGTRAQPLVGDRSRIAEFARAQIQLTNAVIYTNLRLVDEIVALPPTRTDAGRWIWESARAGRARDKYARFEMVARAPESGEASAQGSHSFALVFGDDAASAVKIMDGTFTTFGREGVRQQGIGVIRLPLGGLRVFDPTIATGELRVAFRASGGERRVRTGYFGVRKRLGDDPLHAIYEYTQRADRSGDFMFFGRTDALGDGRPYEQLSARARWDATSAGRVFARFEGGSLPNNEWLVDQCWDDAQVVTYMQTAPQRPGEDGGSVLACPEALRGPSDAPPQYAAPATTADPPIPSAEDMP